jgi:hypothetical protein
MTTQDQTVVNIDLPSIAAGATVRQSVTVSGLKLATTTPAPVLLLLQQTAARVLAYYCSVVTRPEHTQFVWSSKIQLAAPLTRQEKAGRSGSSADELAHVALDGHWLARQLLTI